MGHRDWPVASRWVAHDSRFSHRSPNTVQLLTWLGGLAAPTFLLRTKFRLRQVARCKYSASTAHFNPSGRHDRRDRRFAVLTADSHSVRCMQLCCSPIVGPDNCINHAHVPASDLRSHLW